MLLLQVADFGLPSAADTPPVDIDSLEPEMVHALFRQLPRKDLPHSQELASLLAESHTFLQLAIGFLSAVRDLPSLPEVVRFEVSAPGRHTVPVTMPAASADAMINDAKRLVSSLAGLARSQRDA